MTSDTSAPIAPSPIRDRPVGARYYAALWALDLASLAHWLVQKASSARHHPDIRILLYHDIGEMAPQEDPVRISVSTALFEQHIRFLRAEGYQFLSVEQAAASLAGSNTPKRAVVLTFDDAHVSILTKALPVLKQYAVPATLFVPAGSIGTEQFPWLPLGRFSRPMMWDEVRQLAAEIDLEVGSHTVTHRPLHDLSKAQQEIELEDSRRMIEEQLGRQVRVFAYPFGGWDTFPTDLQRLLQAHRYVAGCTNVMGANREGGNPMALRRIRIGWCDTLWRFRLKLAGAYDWSDRVRLLLAPLRSAPAKNVQNLDHA